MKKVYLGLLFALTVNHATAQGPDLGGVGEFISSVALSARGGSSVDFNKNVSGVLYVPYPSLRSADGKIEYASLGLGADLGAGVSGTRIKGAPLILPMVNVVGLTSLLMRAPWAQSHLSFPALGNIAAGIGLKPLPVVGSNGKWVIGNQISGVVTLGFGKKG